ncbi:PaaI family thioesterase [Paracoccus jeotgali]|uniref:Thioesterase n=1 Tax=Paracoccus jeotgali TaxID=2065379 RepID=A0A2K9MIP9_9RHOB|nr:PaaI family thioesterase [Paracoccus jeotgali]AUM75500.1 thioesterase [Paracoccus jeotgali]
MSQDGNKTADAPDAETRDRIARQFIEAIPHAAALGMRLDRLGAGEASISMPWNADFVGDPRSGVIHGGVISALMDTCCGAAVLSHPTGARSTATIDLRIDYMRAATTRQAIRAVAVCYHVTRSVAFVRAQAFDDDDENPVAAANGAFTLER